MPPPDIKRSWMLRFAWAALFVCLMLMGPLAAAAADEKPKEQLYEGEEKKDLIEGFELKKDAKAFSFSVGKLDALYTEMEKDGGSCGKEIKFDISYSGNENSDDFNKPGEDGSCSHTMHIERVDAYKLNSFGIYTETKDGSAETKFATGTATSVSVTITKDGKLSIKKDPKFKSAKTIPADLPVCKPNFSPTDDKPFQLSIKMTDGAEPKPNCGVNIQATVGFMKIPPPTTQPPTEPTTAETTTSDLPSVSTSPTDTPSNPHVDSTTASGDGKDTDTDKSEGLSVIWIVVIAVFVVVAVLVCCILIAVLVFFLMFAPQSPNDDEDGDDNARRGRRNKNSDEGEDGYLEDGTKKRPHKPRGAPDPESDVEEEREAGAERA